MTFDGIFQLKNWLNKVLKPFVKLITSDNMPIMTVVNWRQGKHGPICFIFTEKCQLLPLKSADGGHLHLWTIQRRGLPLDTETFCSFAYRSIWPTGIATGSKVVTHAGSRPTLDSQHLRLFCPNNGPLRGLNLFQFMALCFIGGYSPDEEKSHFHRHFVLNQSGDF